MHPQTSLASHTSNKNVLDAPFIRMMQECSSNTPLHSSVGCSRRGCKRRASGQCKIQGMRQGVVVPRCVTIALRNASGISRCLCKDGGVQQHCEACETSLALSQPRTCQHVGACAGGLHMLQYIVTTGSTSIPGYRDVWNALRPRCSWERFRGAFQGSSAPGNVRAW